MAKKQTPPTSAPPTVKVESVPFQAKRKAGPLRGAALKAHQAKQAKAGGESPRPPKAPGAPNSKGLISQIEDWLWGAE